MHVYTCSEGEVNWLFNVTTNDISVYTCMFKCPKWSEMVKKYNI